MSWSGLCKSYLSQKESSRYQIVAMRFWNKINQLTVNGWNWNLYEIQTFVFGLLTQNVPEIQKSVWILDKKFVFQTHSHQKCARKTFFCSDFRQWHKFKPQSYWVSEIHTSSYFRHLLDIIEAAFDICGSFVLLIYRIQ